MDVVINDMSKLELVTSDLGAAISRRVEEMPDDDAAGDGV
jgi:hypothetical protein